MPSIIQNIIVFSKRKLLQSVIDFTSVDINFDESSLLQFQSNIDFAVEPTFSRVDVSVVISLPKPILDVHLAGEYCVQISDTLPKPTIDVRVSRVAGSHIAVSLPKPVPAILLGGTCSAQIEATLSKPVPAILLGGTYSVQIETTLPKPVPNIHVIGVDVAHITVTLPKPSIDIQLGGTYSAQISGTLPQPVPNIHLSSFINDLGTVNGHSGERSDIYDASISIDPSSDFMFYGDNSHSETSTCITLYPKEDPSSGINAAVVVPGSLGGYVELDFARTRASDGEYYGGLSFFFFPHRTFNHVVWDSYWQPPSLNTDGSPTNDPALFISLGYETNDPVQIGWLQNSTTIVGGPLDVISDWTDDELAGIGSCKLFIHAHDTYTAIEFYGADGSLRQSGNFTDLTNIWDTDRTDTTDLFLIHFHSYMPDGYDTLAEVLCNLKLTTAIGFEVPTSAIHDTQIAVSLPPPVPNIQLVGTYYVQIESALPVPVPNIHVIGVDVAHITVTLPKPSIDIQLGGTYSAQISGVLHSPVIDVQLGGTYGVQISDTLPKPTIDVQLVCVDVAHITVTLPKPTIDVQLGGTYSAQISGVLPSPVIDVQVILVAADNVVIDVTLPLPQPAIHLHGPTSAQIAVTLPKPISDVQLINIPIALGYTGETGYIDNLITTVKLSTWEWAGETLSVVFAANPAVELSIDGYSGERTTLQIRTSFQLPMHPAFTGETAEQISTLEIDPIIYCYDGEWATASLSTSVSLPLSINSDETLDIDLDVHPSEPIGVFPFLAGESYFPGVNTLPHVDLYVLFRAGLVGQLDIDSTTYFDLKRDCNCGGPRARKYEKFNILMEDAPYPDDIASGDSVIVRVDLSTAQRFSADAYSGQSFRMVDKSTYFQFDFGQGGNNIRLAFEENNLKHRLCKGYFIPSSYDLLIELKDLLPEDCVTNRTYAAEILSGVLSTNLNIDMIIGAAESAILDLTTFPPMELKAHSGESLYISFPFEEKAFAYTGESARFTFYEQPVLVYEGSTCTVDDLSTEYAVRFTEQGCLDNEFVYQNDTGDLIPELFNSAAVEGEPFMHDLKAECILK